MKRLLQGGTVVSGTGAVRADVLLRDERVEAVGRNLNCPEAEVVDVSGMLLLPGFVDAHTHFDLDVSNTTTADDFATGSRAALRGGTTTVVDFACPQKGQSLQYGLDLWHQKARGKAACDYGFHMTIDDWSPAIAGELPAMIDQGVTSFKMYMIYPAMMLGDRDLYLALCQLKDLGAVVGVHCENAGLIDALQAQALAAGRMEPAAHPQTRPDVAEAEAVGRLLKLAQAAQAPVMIVHLSSAAGFAEVDAARRRGQKVWVETCPQYLCLDDSVYSLPGFQGARYVCSPPLRKRADQDRLWRGLADGAVQTVCTDHCSFTLAQKDAGRGNFTKIPGGMPGVETRGLLLYDRGVAAGRISLETMVQILCEHPAKLYGLWGRKGAIAPGFDGDLVVFDPQGRTVITAADSAGAADYAPLEGYEAAGSIRQVYLRGQLVVEAGRLVAEPEGRYLRRELGWL